MNKRYRVYFNRALEAPQCWSVDEGTQDSEINVIGFRIVGAEASSKTLAPGTKVDHHNTPFAWLEVLARELVLENGVAVFY